MSGEHVVPDWIAPLLRDPEGRKGTHHRIVLKSSGNEERTWSDEPATQEVRCVCGPCNRHWMSDLENEVKPYLTPMIQGSYHRYGIAVLARWAVKTALIAGCKFKPPTPPRLYHDFYETRRPSKGAQVWMGAQNERYLHYLDHRPLRVHFNDEPENAYGGYASTLAYGHLSFYVLASEASEPVAHDFGPKFRDAFVQIWPVSGPISMPPSLILDGVKDLDAVADTTPVPWLA